MLKFKWETEFKETNVGKIPRDWKIEELGNLCEKVTDGSHFSPKPQITGYPIATVRNMLDNSIDIESCVRISKEDYNTLVRNGCKPKKGDVLLSKDGTVGICFVFNQDEEIVLLSSIAIIKPSTRLDAFFCKHFFSSKEAREILHEGFLTGSALQRIVLRNLKRVPIAVPAVEEQKRIASVLSVFDAIIENKNRQNEILEKTAGAIFKNWFVDFEPFKDQEFIDSELGKIPKGWQIESISKIGNVILGGTPRREKSNYWNGSIKWAAAKDVANTRGIYILETAESITKDGLNNSNTKILAQNTTIITARGTVGETRLLGDAIAFNQTCYGLVPKNWTSPYFLFLSLRHILGEIKAFAYGTVFDTITMKNFDDMKIPVPHDNRDTILEKFHSIIEPVFHKILSNQKEISVLSKIMDIFLPLLVFGKLRVEEI